MTLGGYEIALLCTISFNIIFWISILCWRLVLVPLCCPKDRLTDGSSSENRINSVSETVANEAPPPYEDALKYPTPRESLSILTVNMSTGEISPLNPIIHGYSLSDISSQTTYMSLSPEITTPEQRESNT